MALLDDFEVLPVPVHLKDGSDVITAVFLPGQPGMHDSHVVIYEDDNEPGKYVVHYLVHDDENQTTYLHQGDYGLTYREAWREVVRRVALNGG